MKEITRHRILTFLDDKLGGHISIGNLTIFGHNAMHWGCHYWTKRWGYVCFRLPLPYNLHWMPLYFYVSPNATPWAATFMLGKRFSRNEKNVAKMRREWFGHNFDTDAHREELHALNQLR